MSASLKRFRTLIGVCDHSAEGHTLDRTAHVSSAVVDELERHIQLGTLEQRDGFLQVITRF